jgi:hypothetical protein
MTLILVLNQQQALVTSLYTHKLKSKKYSKKEILQSCIILQLHEIRKNCLVKIHSELF